MASWRPKTAFFWILKCLFVFSGVVVCGVYFVKIGSGVFPMSDRNIQQTE